MGTVAVACSDYRLVSDRNYKILLCMTYATVEIPCVLIKLSKHMYSARPTLLTDTLAHVKQRGEGTQREGDSSALTDRSVVPGALLVQSSVLAAVGGVDDDDDDDDDDCC